ncbi:CRAL-TRIO domain-containing protein [Phakopsora pachyrhizi]|nr:CRAL-TRIO domain-containing protein [Phakopsora pachyrhizi]
MSPKDKAEDIQVEPDQEHFPSLTPNNLKDLKRFWIRLNSILYPTESDPMRPEDQQLHKSMIDAYELQEFQLSFWNWIMMDDPDTMVCKFLRARKFEVFESLKMLINCLRWRIERKVDQIIESDEIGNQLKTGKAFVHGFDKKGCPIFRITASKHISGAQAPEIVEDFVIYSIESIRLFMIPPNESATILVDLGGFGTSNMDWKCTSFMTNCLEAYYPETLHCSVINRAPWIFTGIWKVIQSMLDR